MCASLVFKGNYMKTYLAFIAFVMIGQLSVANTNGSCSSSLGLGIIQNGETVSGYLISISLPGTPCFSTTVTCINGNLNGPDLYPSCSDILQDCAGIPNGSSVTGYISPLAPCILTTVTCSNGSLSGPEPFSSCNE